MPRRKTILPALVFLLILACNLPQPTAPPNPQNTDAPASASPGLRSTNTPAAPSATETPFTVTLAPPTERPTAKLDFSTVDEFFERCPDPGEVAALLADLPIAIESDPTAGTLACKESEGSVDLSPLQKRVYRSVMIMQYIAFDAPLPWTEKNLYPWFIDTIDAVRVRAGIANSFCCDPVNVINILVAENSYVVGTGRWVDPQMGGGLMDTMVLYVHEARHNEGYGHTCNAGKDDKTIAEMGAWGVQYYLLQWLAQHTDPGFFRAPGGAPEIYRQTALDSMVMIRKTRFCDEPTITPGAAPTLAK